MMAAIPGRITQDQIAATVESVTRIELQTHDSADVLLLERRGGTVSIVHVTPEDARQLGEYPIRDLVIALQLLTEEPPAVDHSPAPRSWLRRLVDACFERVDTQRASAYV